MPTPSEAVALQLLHALSSATVFLSNSCPLVFLFSSQQPHAPPTTSPSSVRRASTSPPLRARLLFGQVLCLFLLFSSPCCYTRRSLGRSSIHRTHSHLQVLFHLITSQHISCSRDAGVPQWQKKQTKGGGQPAPVFTVFTPRVVSTAVARYNFAARDMRELSLREGDVVRIYSKIGGDQGWWKGEANGRVSSPPSRSLSGPLCWFSPRQFKNLFLCRLSVMSQPSTVVNVHPDGSSNSDQHPQI